MCCQPGYLIVHPTCHDALELQDIVISSIASEISLRSAGLSEASSARASVLGLHHPAPSQASCLTTSDTWRYYAGIWGYPANSLTIALLSLPPYALMSRHP